MQWPALKLIHHNIVFRIFPLMSRIWFIIFLNLLWRKFCIGLPSENARPSYNLLLFVFTEQVFCSVNLSNQIRPMLFSYILSANVLFFSTFVVTQGGKWMRNIAGILTVISPRLLSGGVLWGVWPSIITQSPTSPHIWRCFCVNCTLWGFW